MLSWQPDGTERSTFIEEVSDMSEASLLVCMNFHKNAKSGSGKYWPIDEEERVQWTGGSDGNC